MRRKAGALLPLEQRILDAAQALRSQGVKEFYSYQLAQLLKERDEVRLLIARGTLYKALCRLERAGLLESRRRVLVPPGERRPLRKRYRLAADARSTCLMQRDAPDA